MEIAGVSSNNKSNFSVFLYCLLLNKRKQGQIFQKNYFGVIFMSSQVCWSQNIFHVPRHFIRESSDSERTAEFRKPDLERLIWN